MFLIGVGHAVSDLVFRVGDDFLAAHGLTKGATKLIDEAEAELLLAAVRSVAGTADLVAGGSVANTLWGVGALGVSSALWARLGADTFASAYRADLAQTGVEIYEGIESRVEGAASGRCLVFVTPDSERTMATCLGTAGDLLESALEVLPFATARYVYLEGYLWDNPAGRKALHLAARKGRAVGAQVAFSLSDSFCVERHREDFLAFVEQEVDLLFANEQEAALLVAGEKTEDTEDTEATTGTAGTKGAEATGTKGAEGTGTKGAEATSPETASERQALLHLKRLSALCSEVALTRSAQGALISQTVAGEAPQFWRIAPVPPERLADATGAGDFFAAGYLRARLARLSPPVAGAFGARAASAVLGSAGARPASPPEPSPPEPTGTDTAPTSPTKPTGTDTAPTSPTEPTGTAIAPTSPTKPTGTAIAPTSPTKPTGTDTAPTSLTKPPDTPSRATGAIPRATAPRATDPNPTATRGTDTAPTSPTKPTGTDTRTTDTRVADSVQTLRNQVLRRGLPADLDEDLDEDRDEALPEEALRAFERLEAEAGSFSKIAS